MANRPTLLNHYFKLATGGLQFTMNPVVPPRLGENYFLSIGLFAYNFADWKAPAERLEIRELSFC